jgi:hypothetical protein
MPTAANGSVIARNVSGAISATPIFSTGQLHPQMTVRMAIGYERVRERMLARHHARVSAMSRRTSTGAARGACVTQASRRMRPGNSGRRASNSSMSALAPAAQIWRYGGNAQLVQHRSRHGTDAYDELRSSGAFGPVEAAAARRCSRDRCKGRDSARSRRARPRARAGGRVRLRRTRWRW